MMSTFFKVDVNIEGWVDWGLQYRTWRSVSLGRTADDVIGEDIAAASH